MREYGRWIKVAWDSQINRRYNTSIRISAKSRQGILADVVTVINNMKLAVSELNVRDMPDGKTLFFMSIEVSDVEQLDLLTSRLKKNSDVYDVTRIMAGGEE